MLPIAATAVNNSLSIILPLIVVSAGALLLIVLDLFLAPRQKELLAWTTGAVLIVTIGVAVGQWVSFSGGVHVLDHGPRTGFAGMVTMDSYGLFFVVLFCAAGILTVLLSDAYLAARGASRGEFYALMLLVVAGMIGMATSTDLISLFVSFELMSLPTYVLASYARRDRLSGEAGLKYFVNGAFSSAILVFGFAVLYGISGATSFQGIAEGLNAPLLHDGAAIVGFVLIVVGFGFKVSAVPFHGWAPDVYQGAPTPVTAFMSVAVKAGAFAGLLRLLAAASMPAWDLWAPMLTILAVLTMIVGNVLALPQRNLKRMLAYSSIAHAGYLLLGLIAMGQTGSSYGASAVLVYLVAYTAMNIGAFGTLVLIRNRRKFAYGLDEIAGLGRSMPVAAAALALFMLSLTGIPPTAGFWGKFYLFGSIVDAGQTWLAVVAVIMSAVSAFYYLRVIWFMYFEPVAAAEPIRAVGAAPAATIEAGDDADQAALLSDAYTVAVDTGTPIVVTVAALAVAFIGIYPSPLLHAADWAVARLLGG